MNRNRWLALTGIALILAAAVTYFVYRMLQSRMQPAVHTISIVVADKKLTLGTRLNDSNLRMAQWPTDIPLDGKFSDVKEVIGRGAITTIMPNEPILDAKLAPKEAGAGLTSVIPDGMRAVSVKVNDVIGVAGFVLPGTRVDIIMTGSPKADEDVASRIVLENVQVLAAGHNVEQDANGKPQNAQVVTLLVTPEQTQKLALAGVDASIQLALRNPLDTVQRNPAALLRASLFSGSGSKPEEETGKPVEKKPVKSKPAAPKKEVTPAPPADHKMAVEVYQGRTKETFTFTDTEQ
jgi:pilus assembly protein CpaB